MEGTVPHGDVPVVRRRVRIGYALEPLCVANLRSDAFDHEIQRFPFDGDGAMRFEREVLALRVFSPAQKYSPAATHTVRMGLTFGQPSGRTDASQYVAVDSSRRSRAPCHGAGTATSPSIG